MSAAPSFHWQDPLLLDTQLTEEERMVRDAAQAYAQDKLATRVLEAFRHEKTNPAIFSEMGELGLLGATIPEEYGGAGLNYVSYGLIAREVERIDRSEEHTSELQSLMRISYAVFCLQKKNKDKLITNQTSTYIPYRA